MRTLLQILGGAVQITLTLAMAIVFSPALIILFIAYLVTDDDAVGE